MEPLIDHIEITVADDLANRTETVIEQHEKRVVSYEHPRLGFAITSPLKTFAGDTVNRRKPGALHHLAFSVCPAADGRDT